MEIAVVGAPQAGKTLCLQAMGGRADEGGKKGAARLVVPVPDRRVDVLSKAYEPKKTTYARIQFREAAGLGQEHQKGTADFKNVIQGADALLVVVRDFEFFGEAATPQAEARAMLEEMMTLDFMAASSRLEKLAEARKKGKPVDAREAEALEHVAALLEEGKVLEEHVDAESAQILRGYAFLGMKKVAVLLNCDEGRVNEPIPTGAPFDRVPTFRACLPLEAEIAELESDEERQEFLAELGVDEPVLAKVIRGYYGSLDLIPFFTVGPDEVRAWTITRGTNARDAAGEIHSDLSRGFIAAEVLAYDDFVALGGFKEAKTKGKVRVESRDYVVQDGDIITVRFNV